MNNPLVSVVIPMFNNQNTICETLQSVVAQTMKSWEVVCVDDGSSDDSVSVVEDFIKSHNEYNIRVIVRDSVNKGGSVCRNIGAKESKGKYLMFLDADDLLAETCLDNRVKTIEQKSDLQFVVFPMASFVNNDISSARIYSRLHIREPLYFFVTGFGTWQVTSPIFKKSFFEQLNGFNESFPRLQDVEFHIRAIVESQNHYVVLRESAPDCFYRQSGNSLVNAEKLKRAIVGCEKLISLIEMYSSNNVFEDKKRFRLSLFSLYCHISLYQDIIALYDDNYLRVNLLKDTQLYNCMGHITRMFISIIDRITKPKIRYQICRAMDKYLRFRLTY